MNEQRSQRFKLCVFVLAGTAVLLLILYVMGSRKEMFSRSVTVHAEFREVGGLRAGNNVRYAGINVGIVDAIEIVNDTTVLVTMQISSENTAHIRTNAMASIGTDGLIGNKLVNLLPGEGAGEPITNESMLQSIPTLDTEAMLSTLERTNQNLAVITDDLRKFSARMADPDNLLGSLTDPEMGRILQDAVGQLHTAAVNAKSLTNGVNELVTDVQQGKGALGVLLADEHAQNEMRLTLERLRSSADTLGSAIGNVERFTQNLESEDGLARLLTNDSTLTNDVRRMMVRLDTTTLLLNEDLRALQRNFLLRKYFKEKEKR